MSINSDLALTLSHAPTAWLRSRNYVGLDPKQPVSTAYESATVFASKFINGLSRGNVQSRRIFLRYKMLSVNKIFFGQTLTHKAFVNRLFTECWDRNVALRFLTLYHL